MSLYHTTMSSFDDGHEPDEDIATAVCGEPVDWMWAHPPTDLLLWVSKGNTAVCPTCVTLSLVKTL